MAVEDTRQLPERELAVQWRVESLAAEAEISVDTIRYYQKIGILQPPERVGRIAIYRNIHLVRLAKIRELSKAGFSLNQIERLVDTDKDPLFGALQSADTTLSLQQLVEISGFPQEIVELAVDAGLITSLPNDPTRFNSETRDMLSAGSALLAAGLPLDELLQLATRHAENVEETVDDAIRLFQNYLKPNDRDQRSEIVANLVPLVSDLVGGHFRQTLINQASARLLRTDPVFERGEESQIDNSGTPERIHTSFKFIRELVPGCNALAVFNAAKGLPRAFWSIPESRITMTAIGEVFAASSTSHQERFSDISADIGKLNLEVTGVDGPQESGPLLIGGIAFSDQQTGRPPDWDSFGAGRLILPALLIAETPDGTFATRCTEGDYEYLLHSTYLPSALGEVTEVNHHEDPNYEALVAVALETIASGELDKVVAARSLSISGTLDETVILERLCKRFPSCATFAFDYGGPIFLGASPELLISRNGLRVDTMALAGSRPRDQDSNIDAQLREELIASSKERREHQIVVDDIRATLRNAGVLLDGHSSTGVLQLKRNQHLSTPIGGELTAFTSTLDLVSDLHPTPAVAGLPRRSSQDWINHHESFDRGWYAGPVGWLTLNGACEFRVALRSGLMHKDKIMLFAGGGIIEGSVPSHELAETSIKFEALLGVLGLSE
ncbi:MAG: isochorismate synthase [Candidatus Poriferisodalaceae bacterium]|jgi:isochorismate synthase|tara:strand:- start:6320 stop:8332 length:2013 start_codon:yes stop_codon:yes gene_type:complete